MKELETRGKGRPKRADLKSIKSITIRLTKEEFNAVLKNIKKSGAGTISKFVRCKIVGDK